MDNELESKSKKSQNSDGWGGYRDGAGRLKMYQEYPETKQKTVTIPVPFLDEMESVYREEHGRNWASHGVYDILKKWYDERTLSQLDLTD